MGSTLLDMTQIYYWKRVLLSTYYDNLITSKYHRFSALLGLKEFDLSFYDSVMLQVSNVFLRLDICFSMIRALHSEQLDVHQN